jgi:ComF family protein
MGTGMRVIEKIMHSLRKINVENSRTCDGCGVEVFDYPNTRLCDECQGKLLKNNGFTCVKCGRATRGEGVCNACKNNPPAFDVGVSALIYFDATAAFVNRYKNGKRHMVHFFGEELLGYLHRLPKRDYVMVAVPLTKKKLRERGYNQSAEIVLELAEKTGWAYRLDLLEKRSMDSQKTLSATERRKNIVGAFRVRERKACKGKDFLIVDDIMTSGATLSEIASTLLRAGANSVCALTVASVPDRDMAGRSFT